MGVSQSGGYIGTERVAVDHLLPTIFLLLLRTEVVLRPVREIAQPISVFVLLCVMHCIYLYIMNIHYICIKPSLYF